MNTRIAWIVALASSLVVALTWTGYRVHAADRSAVRALEARLEEYLARPDSGLQRPPAAPNPLGGLRAAIEALDVRMQSVERAARSHGASNRVEIPEREADSTDFAEPVAGLAEVPGSETALRQEFEGILSEMKEGGWNFSRSGESFERFLELARETEFLDEMIADQEADIAANPADVVGRMRLAETYLARLMTTSGPEQGLWGSRAEEQWKAVVELDDEQWGAHSALGTNYGYYPEVLGKTAEAIVHLQRAREIQRGLSPATEHVRTYLFLARMHEREGHGNEARDALLEGLQYHPGNEELLVALERMD